MANKPQARETKTSKQTKLELRKVADAIHTASRLGLLAKKSFNAFVFNAYFELKNKDIFKITVSDFCMLTGFNSRNTNHLKQIFSEMRDTAIGWDLLGEENWGRMSILAEVKIIKGVIEYSFPPTLRAMLADDKRAFALIDMRICKEFKSTYSLSLYENCVRFKRTGSTGIIDLSTWKRLLGVDEVETYTDYKRFSEKILYPSISEVNEKSDIILTPEFTKSGRSITAIRFLIQIKQNSPFTEVDNETKKVFLLSRLKNIGVPEEKAKKYIAEYDFEYLDGNLSVVEKRHAAGTAKIPSAYLAKALKEDYRVEVPHREIQTHENDSNQDPNGKQRSPQDDKELEAYRARIETSKLHYDMLNEARKLELQDKFIQHLSTTNIFLLRAANKSGLESKVVETAFWPWLADFVEL